MRQLIVLCMLCASSFIFSQNIEVLKTYNEDFVARSFAYSKNHYFARLSYNNQTIYIENLIHPKKRILIFSRENKGIKTMDFSTDEQYLAVGSYSGDIDIWDVANRKLFETKRVHQKDVNVVRFIPNSPFLISAGSDGRILLTKCDDFKLGTAQIGTHDGIVRSLDIFDDGKYAASVGGDNIIRLWDVFGRKQILQRKINSKGLSFIKTIKKINKTVVGDIDGNIYILNLDNLSLNRVLKTHNSIISSISYLNNEKVLISSYDGSLKVLDIKSYKYYNLHFENKNAIL